MKEGENTWEKGRVNVRGRAQILVQVRSSLIIHVFNLYQNKLHVPIGKSWG